MFAIDNGFMLTMAVATGAGFIRGFTGFGGPAFMLAILTWFYAPLVVIGKILIIECISTSYLVLTVRRDIDWRSTLSIVVPTLIMMPAGHWILTQTEPDIMRRLIAAVTLMSCLIMLFGFRYKKPLSVQSCIALGLVTGLVFGASYIALIFVAFILMGPYNKSQSRSLIIAWGFLTAIWFAALSIIKGHTGMREIVSALPPAAGYFIGTWLGSHLFDRSGEAHYRLAALITLTLLSAVGFLH